MMGMKQLDFLRECSLREGGAHRSRAALQGFTGGLGQAQRAPVRCGALCVRLGGGQAVSQAAQARQAAGGLRRRAQQRRVLRRARDVAHLLARRLGLCTQKGP